MADFKKEIRERIAAADLETALQTAKQAAMDGWTEMDTPTILLQAELEYLKRSNIHGTISTQEVLVKRQSIAARLLSLLEDIAEQPDPVIAASEKTIVLFLGANPFRHLALELEREVEMISAGLQRDGKRQAFDFRAKMHVTPADLQRMLLDAGSPPRVVHFAGNATVNHPEYGTGLLFEDELGRPRIVSGSVLAIVLQQFPGIEAVVLNTCDSGPTAMDIGQHIPYVIGMNARIYDDCAIHFAVAFYEALAGGNTIPFAFEFARTRLLLEQFPEQASIPVLITNGSCAEPVYVPGDSHLQQPSPRLPR